MGRGVIIGTVKLGDYRLDFGPDCKILKNVVPLRRREDPRDPKTSLPSRFPSIMAEESNRRDKSAQN